MAKILVAVADRDERELYVLALRFAGHQLLGAGDIGEAYNVIAGSRPDLTLLDVRLLVANGYDPQESELKIVQDLNSAVVLLVDMNIKPETVVWVKSWEGEYIYTPIGLDQLTRQVNQYLKRNVK